MAADTTQPSPRTPLRNEPRLEQVDGNGNKDSADQLSEDDEDEEDEDADEEPKLKYHRLTTSLGPVYRNGDATSTFIVAGDKMVCITMRSKQPLTPMPSRLALDLLTACVDCRHAQWQYSKSLWTWRWLPSH